jgi:hypothetical protein
MLLQSFWDSVIKRIPWSVLSYGFWFLGYDPLASIPKGAGDPSFRKITARVLAEPKHTQHFRWLQLLRGLLLFFKSMSSLENPLSLPSLVHLGRWVYIFCSLSLCRLVSLSYRCPFEPLNTPKWTDYVQFVPQEGMPDQDSESMANWVMLLLLIH